MTAPGGSGPLRGRHWPAVAVVGAALLVFLLVLVRAGGRGPSGDLPADLGAYLHQLQRLELPAGVDDLGWLPATLSELSVDTLSAEQIAQLPAGLEALEVRRSLGVPWELADLHGLPGSLRRLTLHHAGVERLGGLPDGLETLSLARVRDFDPDGVPATTTRLELGSVRMPSLWRGVEGVESLRLASRLVDSIEGIDRLPRLADLSLVDTRVDSLAGLPRSLRSLDLERARLAGRLRADDLPPLLVELRLHDQSARGLDRLPESLRLLHVSGNVQVRQPLVEALPQGLVELKLDAAGSLDLCGLPPALEVLYLGPRMEADLSCLPAELGSLYLDGASAERLAEIELPLRGLGVVRSSGFGPEHLAAVTPALERLDLSFSTPLALPDLSQLPKLEHLRFVASPLEALPPLPASLLVLDVEDSGGITSISGLAEQCPRLRVLRIGGTGVTSLGGLPATVEELDVRGLELGELDELPPRLVKLTVSAGAEDRLGKLPATLRDLTIVAKDRPAGD